MAVTSGNMSRYMWQGLSSDTKPTDNRVGVNDVFFETDTGRWFLWNVKTASWTVSSPRPPMELIQ
jgi:hypothetical protein